MQEVLIFMNAMQTKLKAVNKMHEPTNDKKHVKINEWTDTRKAHHTADNFFMHEGGKTSRSLQHNYAGTPEGKHSVIANHVHVGKTVRPSHHDGVTDASLDFQGDFVYFNLLEVTGNGEPTTQAKASALDTILMLLKRVWFAQDAKHVKVRRLFDLVKSILYHDSPCKAIFNAAWEVVKDD